MRWLVITFVSLITLTSCVNVKSDVPKGLMITAAHVPETMYPEMKLLYVNEELDTAYYWKEVGAYEYGPFRMKSNKGSYSVSYNKDYVFDKGPEVGTKVEFAGLTAKVVSNYDKSFNVKLTDSEPYTGLSGSNVKQRGVTIGIVTRYQNGEIICQKVR